MADDDKGVKPAIPLPVEEQGTVKPSAGYAPPTEWTASDRRGRLESAGDSDGDRIAPADEMDAEGGAAPAAHEPLAHQLATHDISNAATGSPEVANHDGGKPAASPIATSAEDAPGIATPSEVVATSHERKGSLVPVAAGLVIGAVIGAGSAWLVYSQSSSGAGANQQITALSARVDALDKRPDQQPEVAKLQSGFTDLQGKVASVEKQVAGSNKVAAVASPTANPRALDASTPAQVSKPMDDGLAGKIAGLQASLGELKIRTAALQAQDGKAAGADDKIKALQSNLSEAQKQTASEKTTLDTLRGQQKQLGDKLAGLTGAVAGALKKADGAEQKAEGAEKQAADAQSGLDGVQSRQKALEAKLGSPALAVVADSLIQQIDAGQPYTRQTDALAALSADPAKISILRENASRGVPSARSLLERWKPLADPVIATGNKAPANANFGQKLEHGLFGLVSVRRADGTSGNDLASRVNLIEADLGHDDVAGAYTTWQALPADARSKSDSWGALAKTSVEALAAARDLQHSAIDALGAKKS